jgi:hypothetical protein
MKNKITKYQILKRIIEGLKSCYPCQDIKRQDVIKVLDNQHFLSTYVYY